MSIRIDSNSCIGCGACTEACPGNLLTLQSGSAHMRSIRDCWGCTACMKVCPVSAIHYFLGADLGGRGSEMTISSQKDSYIWLVTMTDGTTREIVINRKSANKY